MAKQRVSLRVVCPSGRHVVGKVTGTEIEISEAVYKGAVTSPLANPDVFSHRSIYPVFTDTVTTYEVTCQCGITILLDMSDVRNALHHGTRVLVLTETLGSWLKGRNGEIGPRP